MGEILTITIPTYNRHDKLLSTLRNIYSFKNQFPVKVIVIDNCSTPDVLSFLVNKKYEGFSYTTVIRNYGNIGAAANVATCFVRPDTEWMWLLGDDDPPLNKCFENIYLQIKSAAPDTFLIKFNSDAGDFPKCDMTISSEKEFIDFCRNLFYYSNMLFMSNSIFRVQEMQKYLRFMFEYTNTMAPHIIGILKNVADGKKIKLINNYIVEHGKAAGEDKWDLHKLVEGVLHFSDLYGHDIFKTAMVRQLLQNYIGGKGFYKPFFGYPFHNKYYPIKYWHWFYWKSAFLFTGIKSLYLLILSITVKYYYNCKVINTLFSKRIPPASEPNFDRC